MCIRLIYDLRKPTHDKQASVFAWCRRRMISRNVIYDTIGITNIKHDRARLLNRNPIQLGMMYAE